MENHLTFNRYTHICNVSSVALYNPNLKEEMKKDFKKLEEFLKPYLKSKHIKEKGD